MGKFVFDTKPKTVNVNGKSKRIWLLETKEFDKFNPSVLGLGDISQRSTEVEAIAAIFDLSGFTRFCGHVDPHLTVPEYLSGFLEWLFKKVKEKFLEKSYEEGKRLWAELPFLAKFLGDGALFLWDTKSMGNVELCNVLVSCNAICKAYARDFYPEIKKVVVDPPSTLRCGVARGRVCSVGNGEDYVGPCINIASRLQNLSGLTFCFARRGFDIEKDMRKNISSQFAPKSVSLRGIGEELVYVLKEEFDNLPDDEKRLFKAP